MKMSGELIGEEENSNNVQNLCEIINLKGEKCVHNDYNDYNNINVNVNVNEYYVPFIKKKQSVCRYNISVAFCPISVRQKVQNGQASQKTHRILQVFSVNPGVNLSG